MASMPPNMRWRGTERVLCRKFNFMPRIQRMIPAAITRLIRNTERIALACRSVCRSILAEVWLHQPARQRLVMVRQSTSLMRKLVMLLMIYVSSLIYVLVARQSFLPMILRLSQPPHRWRQHVRVCWRGSASTLMF